MITNNFIEIDVTSFDITWAKQQTTDLAEAVKGTTLKNRFNTDWQNNNVTGYLGERIVHKWLTSIGKQHCWQNEKFGESDDYDFLIAGKKWDVKTNLRHQPVSSIKDSFQLMVLEDQLNNGHADYYLWVLLQGSDPCKCCKAFIIGGKGLDNCKQYPTIEKIKGLRTKWIPVTDVITPLDCTLYFMCGV